MRALIALCLISSALFGQTTTRSDLLRARLTEKIRATDRELDGVIGVGILDLATGDTLLHNGDFVFPIASTIKILVLAELTRQSAAGSIDLNEEKYTLRREDVVGGDGVLQLLTPGVTTLALRDLATLTVTNSDNTATNILIDRLGMTNINRFAEGLELKQTRLRRKMMDTKAAEAGRENTSTPREMLTLLRAIHGGPVVDLLLLPKDSTIPDKLPAVVRVANKPGTLDGVRTDSGIVFVEGRPFAIAVMTTFVTDGAAAEEAIREIAAAAYRYFDRLARSSEHGRALR